MIRTIQILLFLLFLGINAIAQEQLVPIGTNIDLKSYTQTKIQNVKTSKAADTLSLPIVDDFAMEGPYPSDKIWSDNLAFVNHSYGINMPSIGVATLDAIDSQGAVYSSITQYPSEADQLTSHPIDLSYSASDSVYLSFYYQPQGLGDCPEEGDSLLVEFYSPDDDTWHPVWKAYVIQEDDEPLKINELNYINKSTKEIGKTDNFLLYENFFLVLIPIQENKFLKRGFRFRFRNFVSINTTPESKESNLDHWNIDFVYLDKSRNMYDTIINDLAFARDIESLLHNYEAIPWSHFLRASAYEMKDSIEITYANLSDQHKNITREFEIIDLSGQNETYAFTGGGGDDLDPFAFESYKRKLNYIFPYEFGEDSAAFEIKSYLITDTLTANIPYRWNDTTRFYQRFYNYYAYDDGIPESGYGLAYNNSEYAKVAIEFNTYVKDTLQAVQIFFNKTLKNNEIFFNIKVWAYEDGLPGEELLTVEYVKPQYENELNKFYTYKFDEKIILNGKFFIGWQKSNTTEMLNVGFDKNNINNDKVYTTIYGNWAESRVEGTIMIRPVFGKPFEVISSGNPDFTEDETEMILYPNPAHDHINININSASQFTDKKIEIINMQGSVVYSGILNNEPVNISNLSKGLYFVKVTCDNNNILVEKLLINK